MDGWQAVQNWAAFSVLACGVVYYYYPRDKKVVKSLPPAKDVKREVKKAIRKPDQEKKTAHIIPVDETPNQAPDQNSTKKRKANTQPPPQTIPSNPDQKGDQDEIDMSTRQFAANMQRAREGIQVKTSSNKDTRVKTVKPKNSPVNTPLLSSGSSQADAEDDWSDTVSPALQARGIDDMLEPSAPGPSALRITASEKPVKEKVNKPAKKEVVETKKQRQNRKKVEQQREAREADEAERKALAERQRRTARESRGEPAKNGVPVSSAPLKNPWAEQNAARDAHLPVVDNTGSSVQLLDTLDTESNSSSNQEASTAATSTTDAAPSRWAEEEELAKAVKESERESGWNEVKSNKKTKAKRSESNGNTTPVAAPVKSAASVNKPAPGTKPVGFQALSDEAEQNGDVDSNDPSAWGA